MVECASLYCAREGSWYSDVIMETFGSTLQDKYCNNKTLILPTMSLLDTTTRTEECHKPQELLWKPRPKTSCLCLLIYSACIVVDSVRGRTHCYDSVDKRTHLKLLEDIGQEIQATTRPGFTQRLWKEAGSNYTSCGLRLKCWEILQLIVPFSKKQIADGVCEMQI
ncbi:SUMO protease [Phytophthora palmivora]|uniref:SUMO protease n=1 Tax=Phytophthora palmivora TaxID=4796 RepID=A0A2P4XGI9_9STRA|nr:SUMO protease [Phytophthora palmivora]